MSDIHEVIKRSRRRRRLPTPDVRRLLRQQARLSQEDIAVAMGVSRAAVVRWERGERTPRQPHYDAYVELLDQLRREVLPNETD